MRRHSFSRGLLLERLESRCLLAGGFHPVEVWHHPQAKTVHGDRPLVDQVSDHRAAGNQGHRHHDRAAIEDRSLHREHRADAESDVNHVGLGLRPRHRHSQSSPPRPLTPTSLSIQSTLSDLALASIVPPLSDPAAGEGERIEANTSTPDSTIRVQESRAEQNFGTTFVSIRVVFSPVEIPSLTRFVLVQPQASSENAPQPRTALEDDKSGDAANPVSVNLDTAADSETDDDPAVRPSGPLIASSVPAGANSSVVESIGQAIAIASDRQAIESRPARSGFVANDRAESGIQLRSLDAGLGHADQGVIPLSRLDLQQDSRDPDESWYVDRAILERLREFDPPSNERQNQASDAAPADWFDGPGGLVELSNRTSHLAMSVVVSEGLEIPLDPVLRSHRMLPLASAGGSEESDLAVRDAVLSAIAGEQADHADPLFEPAVRPIRPLVASGVGLLAGTLVVLGRYHKRGAADPRPRSSSRSNRRWFR